MKSALFTGCLVFLTLFVALLCSGLLVGADLGAIFTVFFGSSIGTMDGLLQTLMRATPLLTATLGLIIAFRCGVWNIGGEGQILIGVLATTGICLFLEVHPFLALLLSFCVSFLLSGLYAAMAGVLKAWWGVNEIAVTMMQTFIALAVLQYLIDGPWNWGIGLYPRTAPIPPETRLPFIRYPLNVVFLASLALTAIMYFLLDRTVFGYELRAIGSNLQAARSYGIPVRRLIVLSMFLSGGVCGWSGMGLVVGEFFRAQAGMSGNFGFYAIATSLIAGNNFSFAPLSALLIAFLYQGTLGITALGVPHRLGEVIIGVVFLIVLLPRMKGRTRELWGV